MQAVKVQLYEMTTGDSPSSDSLQRSFLVTAGCSILMLEKL